ncbi:hypothetical protein quinque_000222 [Culex quinquefasciatus]
MRHKWLLLMCVGVILVQATLANAEDGSNSQNESEEGANQAEVSDQQSTQSPSVDEQNADKDFENDSMNPDNNSTDTDTATAKPQKETAYVEHVHSNRESKAVIPAVGRTTTKKPSYICTKSNLNYDCILQNNSEKFTSQRENEGLEAVLKNIKADESKLKKEKQLLEKTLNRNSPSVHG